ncbi:urease accessory protein UreH [Gynuella sunshinyii YC6258]|uniref:Urease accessory protein UreD n=1 Tax=Gynuella sunshinyii YC6258 TaxID=1445510 RepID=A0A0C5VR10_9GAMM|nr:urease accessory protein UreH [Gynuella sunshinyii YC6258]
MDVSPISANGHWEADIYLQLAATVRGTRLLRNEHRGPLYVQKPFYPEGHECAHVYLLHPPGGLVSGDRLNIEIDLAAGAQTLVTTPGAGRVYRARDDASLQRQSLTVQVADDAMLEWLPLETILFPAARVHLNTEVHLEAGGRCLLWDIISFGLPANQQPFDRGELDQRLRIYQGSKLVINERLLINEQSLPLLGTNVGFRGAPVYALMLAGPFAEDIHEDVMQQLRYHCTQIDDADLAAISRCGDFLSIRFCGWSAEQARRLLTRLWCDIRPLLTGRDACMPRIWAT